jgi:hypothetical protein
MNTQEMKIRAVLLEQSTYQNCSAATRSQCALNPQKIAPFQFIRVPGCAGQPPASCGVQLMSVNFNNSNLTFTGTLHYNGNDVAIHDSVINFSLPPEVLQDKQITCPSGSPFFSGFASDGSVICNAFPNDCGPGKYASGFQISTLQPICQDLPSTVTCAANEILTSYEWLGGTTGLSTKCQTRDRSSAESMFQFSPQYSAATLYAPPPPVNCQGAWGACTGTCGTGTQTYVITTPSANGGLACPVANGATQSCALTACPVPLPPYAEAIITYTQTYVVPAGVTQLEVIAIGGGGGGGGKGANNNDGTTGDSGTFSSVQRGVNFLVKAEGGLGGGGGGEHHIGVGGGNYDPGENSHCSGSNIPQARGGGRKLLSYGGTFYGYGGGGQTEYDDRDCRAGGGGGGSGQLVQGQVINVVPGEVLYIVVGNGGLGGHASYGGQADNGANGLVCMRRPGDPSSCVVGAANSVGVVVASNSFGPSGYKSTYDDLRSPLAMCREAGYYSDYVDTSGNAEYACRTNLPSETIYCKHNGNWQIAFMIARFSLTCPGQDWCGGFNTSVDWVKCLPY